MIKMSEAYRNFYAPFHIDLITWWFDAGRLFIFCDKEPFSAKAVFL